MRWLSIPALLLAGSLAAASQSLPRGSHDFQLAAGRAQVDSAIAARGLEVLSSGVTHVACAGDSRAVEFEQYDFAPSAGGEGHLWRVTIAYRVPYGRADFDSLQNSLVADLGEPAQVEAPTADDPDGLHKVTWVDVRTSVQLAARWPERPDPRTDRMLLVWTDRQLQKVVEAQALKKSNKKK